MGYEGSGDRVFQQRGMNCPSDSESLLYGSNWDQIVSLNQSGQFGNSAMVSQNEFAIPHCSAMLENQAMGSTSQLVQFPSDPSGLVDIMPRIPGYGSEIFSEMVTSPYGKRKREVIRGSSPMNAEEEQRKDSSGYTSENPKEDDEKKQKVEKSAGQNSRGKQASKQAKDNADDAEPSKENYIHLRAKRGQATNSHSLAERVRREKISERMRLLQELVPGCNKITGKAMMLDEIINYVQSLQQQVEFLSMKLATVNPELNVDLDRILSKDILQLRSNNVNRLGIAPGLGSAHPFPKFPQGPFNGFPGTSAPFQLLPQHIWNNNELQGLFQMGFDPDPSVSMGQNGNCSDLLTPFLETVTILR